MRDPPRSIAIPPRPISYDEALGRQIVELHVWAVGQGLRGTAAAELFEGLCERLVMAGGPLWRAFAGMRTLHPQWGGYGYNLVWDLQPVQRGAFGSGNASREEDLNR